MNQENPGGTSPAGTILLVDDEPMIRELLAMMLADEGYAVLTAENGLEALAVYEQHGATVDLLLTDMKMPAMGGQELIDRLRASRPTLKVLAISGHLPCVPAGGVPFLPKPFTREALLSGVRAVLEGRDSDRGLAAPRA